MRRNTISTPSSPTDLRRIAVIALALALLGGATSGCVSLAVGAAATGGVAAAQERSVGDAIDDLTIRTTLNALFFEENIDLYQGRLILGGRRPGCC